MDTPWLALTSTRIVLVAETKRKGLTLVLKEISVLPASVGIEMQFEYRYQTLFWLCISIDIEISFHAVKSVILHLLILQLSKLFY